MNVEHDQVGYWPFSAWVWLGIGYGLVLVIGVAGYWA